MITQVDEDDEEDGDDSVKSNKQKKQKKFSQSYYEQENQELKKKLSEKSEQIKKLQEKIFQQAQQPRQQETLLIKKMQTDMSILQKKINDQKRFIEELTHKLIKQNKEKEDASSITKARDQLQNDIKEMYNQIKVQVNEEIQQQIKNNISSYQNLTPNKSQDIGECISTQPFEKPNQQSHLLSAAGQNNHILKHSSFDTQQNKNKNESSFSTIYNSHSRQNSQFTDFDFNQQSQALGCRLAQNANGNQFDEANLNQIEDTIGIQINIANCDQIENNPTVQQQKPQKQSKESLSLCDVDKDGTNQFDISQNTKKSQNSNETLAEDLLIFDQSVIDRLDKLQGLLLKDQKIISQLFFSSTISSTS